jgi:CTP synthase (UTP-ammonia lyase)
VIALPYDAQNDVPHGVLRVALVGDFDASVTAHRAIPKALRLVASRVGVDVDGVWVATDSITSDEDLAEFDAVWCVPASPYRSTDGALRAIRIAREQRVPFLGTCGGFQHAVIEYARSVLGWHDADHAETATGGRLVITPLACQLVEVRDMVRFVAGTRIADAYGAPSAAEGYHCRYGLSAEFREALTSGALRVSALDEAGDIRAVELDGHPFFVATLFQPERAALAHTAPPIVVSFVRAALAQRGFAEGQPPNDSSA